MLMAARATCLPVVVLPVKATLATAGWELQGDSSTAQTPERTSKLSGKCVNIVHHDSVRAQNAEQTTPTPLTNCAKPLPKMQVGPTATILMRQAMVAAQALGNGSRSLMASTKHHVHVQVMVPKAHACACAAAKHNYQLTESAQLQGKGCMTSGACLPEWCCRVCASPITTLRTPGGTPACDASSCAAAKHNDQHTNNTQLRGKGCMTSAACLPEWCPCVCAQSCHHVEHTGRYARL